MCKRGGAATWDAVSPSRQGVFLGWVLFSKRFYMLPESCASFPPNINGIKEENTIELTGWYRDGIPNGEIATSLKSTKENVKRTLNPLSLATQPP
jgi:hypothetical protein